MNNLGLYIRKALNDRSEIYLPEIGVFKKEHIPAFFNDQENCFMPPSQSFTFTSENASDQSLIEFIAKKDKISLDESRLKIESTVNKLNTALENSEEVLLEGLGKLSKHNQTYKFIYIASEVEGGFREYDPVEEIEVIEYAANTSATPVIDEAIEEEAGVVEPLVVPVVEEPVTMSAPPPVNEEEQDLNDTNSKRWLWPVIGVAVCILIAGVWFLQPDLVNTIFNKKAIAKAQNKDNQTEQVKEEELPQNQALISAVSPSELEKDTEEPLNEGAQETTTPQEIQEVASIIREPEKRFEIIIASFKTMKEAETYVKTINAKGYNVYIVKNNNPGNYKKISYASFNTEQEAEQALAKVRQELTKDAWTYENKKFKNQ